MPDQERERTNPRTCVLEARTDICTIASIAKFLIDNNFKPQTKSELVRIALEHYVLSIVQSTGLEPFTDPVAAAVYLNENGYGKLHSRGTLKAFEKELKLAPYIPVETEPGLIPDWAKAKTDINPDLLEQAKRLLSQTDPSNEL